MIDGTGVAARSGITCSTMGEGGGEGDDGGCGTGRREDTSAVWGSTGGERGEGGADSRIEWRGDDGEVSLTTSSSLDICTSSSGGNSSSNKAEAGGNSSITPSTADGGGTITAASGDGGGGVLEIEAGLGGRSVGTSKFEDESETIEVDGASTHLPNQSLLGVVPRQEYRHPQEKPASSDRPSVLAGSGSEDGVGDTSLTGTVLLKGLHLSAAEGDTEEGLLFAWTWTVTLSGVGEEVSRGRVLL